MIELSGGDEHQIQEATERRASFLESVYRDAEILRQQLAGDGEALAMVDATVAAAESYCEAQFWLAPRPGGAALLRQVHVAQRRGMLRSDPRQAVADRLEICLGRLTDAP